jgi:hypothetical protein
MATCLNRDLYCFRQRFDHKIKALPIPILKPHASGVASKWKTWALNEK